MCLSLLGTWSGPGWVAGKSTLLQVSDPVYNNRDAIHNTVPDNPGLNLYTIHDIM